MVVKRLSKPNIDDLRKLLRVDLPDDLLKEACNGGLPSTPQAQMYGIYKDDRLVSAALATFMYVMPTLTEPAGREVKISGIYTLPEFRNKGYMSELYKFIESDAIKYFAADRLTVEASSEFVGFYKNNDMLADSGLTYMSKNLHKE